MWTTSSPPRATTQSRAADLQERLPRADAGDPAWLAGAEGDERVSSFLERPLEGDWPYVWLDATYLKQRQGGRIISVAVIIAVAASTEGRREIIGLNVGLSEAAPFWVDFLRSLHKRGLKGVSW